MHSVRGGCGSWGRAWRPLMEGSCRLHVQVSLGKLLNPKQLPMAVLWIAEWLREWHNNMFGHFGQEALMRRLAPCMAACAVGIPMCVCVWMGECDKWAAGRQKNSLIKSPGTRNLRMLTVTSVKWYTIAVNVCLGPVCALCPLFCLHLNFD